MVQKILNWKESINTVLLAVVSYLIVDMHNTFKEVIKDVEDLKAKSEHEKLEVQKQFDLKELESIKLSEEEKAKARNAKWWSTTNNSSCKNSN